MKQAITSAALLCAAAAFAADAPAPTAARTAETPAAGGQMIFVDPGTGEIRQPTVEEWSQLPRPIAPKAKKAIEHVRPDGAIEIPAGALSVEIKATLAGDGSVKVHCEDPPADSP